MADPNTDAIKNELGVDREKSNVVIPTNINLELPVKEKEKSFIKDLTSLSQTPNEEKDSNENINAENLTEQEINNLSRLDDNDLDEFDPDLYITEEEKQAFEYMLSQKREQMVERREKFEQWVDNITRRRMFALSRIRKINQKYGIRKQFYGDVNSFVNDVHASFNDTKLSSSSKSSETNTPNPNVNHTASGAIMSSVDPKRAGFETQGNMEREETGFITKSTEITNSVDKNLPIIVPVHS